jgi:alpha/beta superfamily hydrolase
VIGFSACMSVNGVIGAVVPPAPLDGHAMACVGPRGQDMGMPRGMRIALVLVASLAACAQQVPGSTAPTLTASPSSEPSASDESPPTLEAACGPLFTLDATPMWLVTEDEVRLYAVVSGDGPTTLVLAHEGRGNLCGWLRYMKSANEAGIRTLAFDFRTRGESEGPEENRLALGRDLATAVDQAWAGGAAHVFLMGASMGGAAIVQNSASLRVDGRISLSGTRLWQGYGIDDPDGVASIREPFLYIGSRADPLAPMSEVDDIFDRIGSSDKQQQLYDGTSHGWSLIADTPLGSETRALILAWIEHHL